MWDVSVNIINQEVSCSNLSTMTKDCFPIWIHTKLHDIPVLLENWVLLALCIPTGKREVAYTMGP